MKTKKKKIKRPNALAAALTDPRYRARVVKSAKVYSRKAKAAEKPNQVER